MPSPKPLAAWAVAAVAALAAVVVSSAPRRTLGQDPPPAQLLPPAYRLESGRALKRLPPPYVPERLAAFQALVPGPGGRENPDYIVFCAKPADGVHHWGHAPGGKMPLRYVLTSLLRVSAHEIDGPDALLSLDLLGDWVIDPDASTAAKLNALTPIIQQAHGRVVRFERRDVERDALVARGQFQLKPLPDVRDPATLNPIVFLFTGLRDPARGGLTSGTPDQFLQELGRCAGRTIVDETRGARPGELRWVPQISARVVGLRRGPDPEANLRALMENVSAQTGLTFEPARLKVPTWVVVEGPAAG